MHTTLIITWSTNYNGVWVAPEDLDDKDYDIVENINDEMCLPSVTHDMCKDLSCFEDPILDNTQIEQLKNIVRNNEEFKKLYGEFDVKFEYDRNSS